MTLEVAVKNIRRPRTERMIRTCQTFTNSKLHVLAVWEVLQVNKKLDATLVKTTSKQASTASATVHIEEVADVLPPIMNSLHLKERESMLKGEGSALEQKLECAVYKQHAFLDRGDKQADQ